MIRLTLNKAEAFAYPADVARIVQACAHAGYAIDCAVADAVWSQHSERMAAGWLFLPESDQELVDIVREHTLEED